MYVTAVQSVQGKYARTWAQGIKAVPQGARTIQRLRNEMTQMIDDVTGQTNCCHGLMEYFEKKVKFYNQCHAFQASIFPDTKICLIMFQIWTVPSVGAHSCPNRDKLILAGEDIDN